MNQSMAERGQKAPQSRRELDTNPTAAERFHEHLRKPYLAWRDGEGDASH